MHLTPDTWYLSPTREMEEDANKHGAAYARFKQSIMKEFEELDKEGEEGEDVD